MNDKSSSFKNMFFKERKTETIYTIDVDCPYCACPQTVSESAVSALCRKCKRIYDVKKVVNQPEVVKEEPPKTPAPEKNYFSDSKPIICSFCRTKQEVPTVAISAFCKKCGQRINLQDYKKNDFFRGDLETKGTLFITSTGNVNGNVSVGEAIIDGKFQGKMVSDGLVKLQPGSVFHGELNAPKIEVSEGAIFIGSSVVKPI